MTDNRKIITIIALVLAGLLAISTILILIFDKDSSVPTGAPVETVEPENTEMPTDAPTEVPTAEPTPVPATPTPVPTAVPTPKPTIKPVTSLAGLSTASNGWWYGQYKGTVDGIEQYDYKTPENLGDLVHKYGGITGHGSGKMAYLTFDEGYENGFTPKILDVLKAKNVKAIFFVTGDFVEQEPELIKRMYNEGHIIGNHTDNHPRMPEQTDDRFKKELLDVEEKVNNVLGIQYDMKYYRPPEGKFSERDLALASQMGYKAVFWSFAHVDWEHPKEPSQDLLDKTYKRIIQSIHEQEVLLLHAVSSANTAVLGDVIDYYRSQGYTFGTMEDL
ncbi:MAG: delta-lactam-biosynthetic de-N-acetylase [Ruminococcaceae bacterium]|nr:delta-lactam-biosynthetic de-N-acetylase [Oscillospiraceae bacterium]